MLFVPYSDCPIRRTLQGGAQAGGRAVRTRTTAAAGLKLRTQGARAGKAAGAAAAAEAHRDHPAPPRGGASPRPRASPGQPGGQGRGAPPGAAAPGPGRARGDGAAAASSLTVVRHHGLALVQLLRGPQMVLDALELRRQRGQRRGRHGAGGGERRSAAIVPGAGAPRFRFRLGRRGWAGGGRGERPLLARRRRAGLSLRLSVCVWDP